MDHAPRSLWLPFLREAAPAASTPEEVAASELREGLKTLAPGSAFRLAPTDSLGRDGYRIDREAEAYVISGGEAGLLYGAYALLTALAAGRPVPRGDQCPRYPDRMINCWDNMDGTIERGYSGPSLWFRDGRLDYDPARLRQLARLLASVGLNVLCVNNVNVHEPAQELIGAMLPDLARLAALFRPYGVRLMVSIDFSQPMRAGLSTADPLSEDVQGWWRACADRVWAAIPDFYGFLVKADSEHRPGPFTYGRTHAEGANMLARAIAPHGGRLVWRCFVYNCQQDWRDTATDRPCAAWKTYQPLDGAFDSNVILQVKNGPFDFQVREPVSPLLLSMRHTALALEVQLAQEYTGHQLDIYAMAPMWKELFDQLPPERLQAMAAVSNLGADDCITGHPFAAVNLYGFGRLAWDPLTGPDAIISDWVRLTYALPLAQQDSLIRILRRSRAVYEKYTAPLGLCWMVRPNTHYGPSPDGYEYDSWGTYHRADRQAVGIDRTAKGTGYAAQYPPQLQALYESLDTCPDELLLFFHRLRYDYVMRDGRTLIQRIYDDHFEGMEETLAMARALEELDLPQPDRREAAVCMRLQLNNAREWCDVINSFFYRLSGVPDQKGRKLYL